MPTLHDALQTILAGDYGLAEGDHIKLCDILKKAHEESQKGKSVKHVTIKDLKIKIKFLGGRLYCLDKVTTTEYVQRGGDFYIHPDYKIEGRIEIRGETKSATWEMEPDRLVKKIINMEHSFNVIEYERDGIASRAAYSSFLQECIKKDLLEKKLKGRYGPTSDDHDESDEACYRGDYTYNRFVHYIASSVTYY